MASDSKYGRPRGAGTGSRARGSASVPQMDAASLGFSGMCGLVYSLSLCRKLLVSGVTRLGGGLRWVSAHLHGRSCRSTLEHLFQSTELQSSGF